MPPSRLIQHTLSSNGPTRLGYDALDMDLVGRGWDGKGLGKYDELCYLADKVARFRFEFHAADYPALALPAIPSTASSGAIHQMLKTERCADICKF